MPAFDAVLSSTSAAGTPTAWIDSHTPARNNPNPAHPHSYIAVPVPGSITFDCRIGGVTAPLDSDPVMAGRTFSAVLGLWSGDAPPTVVQAAGRSSRITVTLAANNVGHHQLLVTLPDGGSIGVPFDGE